MARKRITEKTLTQKPPPTGRRIEVWDSVVTGLCLRITDRGARSWSVMFRHGGKQHRVTIGTYPAVGLVEARQRARDILIDPTATLAAKAVRAVPGDKPASGTVEAIMSLWLKRDQANRRSAPETERLMRRELADWLARPLADLKRRDVQEMIDNIADRAPAMARRFNGHLHRLGEWALRREYIPLNPAHGVDVPEHKERDRVLTDDEVRAIWTAAGHVGWPHGAIVRLLLLLPCRVDEIAHLRWAEIDAERREITIPSERSKNGFAHTIPLSDQALAIIESLPRVENTAGLMFPSPRSGSPLSGWGRVKGRLDKLSGVAPKWQLRDTRRTVRTGLDRLGCPFEVGEALLNHRSETRRGVAGTYRRYGYQREQRVWAQKWCDEIDRVLTGESAKVVNMRSAG